MMKKKHVRIISFSLGIIILILLLFNFGVNYWLRSKMPDYIKNNSAYNVSYENLSVDLVTGDISASEITVSNKNPDDRNVIGIEGKMDTLAISRLGIYDAIFNKRINSSDLQLINPDLKIILAKPVDDKTGKKRNPILFENLTIKNGNIAVFRHTEQKFLGVNDLNISIENLQLIEEKVERKLPFVFDKYDINGKNFYFRPDNIYAITSKFITTEKGQMSMKQFAVVPLLSHKNFMKFHPNKKNLYDFKTAEMNYKDIFLAGNKVSLANAHFVNPELKIFTTNAKPSGKAKDFAYEVNMENVLVKDARIEIIKPNGTPSVSATHINLNIEKFEMDGETSKSSVPFVYANVGVSAREINVILDTQRFTIGGLAFNPKRADIRNVSAKPTVAKSNKMLMDFTVPQAILNINELAFVENKLKLDIQNVSINGFNGKITAANNPSKKKPDFSGISFPLIVKNIALTNSNLTFIKGNSPLNLKNFRADLKNIEMNAATAKEALPFKIGDYKLTSNNFNYKTEFYNLSTAALNFSKNAVEISSFALKPTVSRAQFIRRISAEKDLYDLKVNQITMNGRWDLFSENKYLDASQVILNGINANIFRSKIPKDDLSEKPLYSSLLRSIKFPMFIKNLAVKNSFLEYEEDTKKSDGPGKLTFNNFTMNVKNLNSGKMKGKPNQVAVAVSCLFMNASPMKVNWSFDTTNMNDAFAISGNVEDLPASRVNPFIEPYLKIRATGLIADLIFDFKGNRNGLNGSLKMKHKDLKIALLKEDGDKNKVLSAVANIFVRSNSGSFPASAPVDNVPRDKTKSFFNLFWKGIEEGLKKTLIGRNVENTEKAIKNTVENTKTALEQNKTDLQETKQEVSEKVENAKEKVQKTRTGIKNIFRKKSE